MTPTGADPAPGMGRASRCPVDHLTPRRRTGEAHARFGHQGCTRHCRMEDAWRKPHRWSTTLAEFCALTGPGHAHVGRSHPPSPPGRARRGVLSPRRPAPVVRSWRRGFTTPPAARPPIRLARRAGPLLRRRPHSPTVRPVGTRVLLVGAGSPRLAVGHPRTGDRGRFLLALYRIVSALYHCGGCMAWLSSKPEEHRWPIASW